MKSRARREEEGNKGEKKGTDGVGIGKGIGEGRKSSTRRKEEEGKRGK